MTPESDIPSLATLEYLPYIDDNGQVPEQLQGKIGVFAIFDQQKVLQFINYSRDISLSLKQHLVRKPHSCYWVKVKAIDKPNRTLLEDIRNSWIEENGEVPSGNGSDEAKWNQPIDAKPAMTAEEQAQYTNSDELMRAKLLKTVARRVEEQIFDQLKSRGVQMELRFNPKLKETGLLDLK